MLDWDNMPEEFKAQLKGILDDAAQEQPNLPQAKFTEPCKRLPGGDIHFCFTHGSLWREVPQGMRDGCLFIQVMEQASVFAWEPTLINALNMQAILSMWLLHHHGEAAKVDG